MAIEYESGPGGEWAGLLIIGLLVFLIYNGCEAYKNTQQQESARQTEELRLLNQCMANGEPEYRCRWYLRKDVGGP